MSSRRHLPVAMAVVFPGAGQLLQRRILRGVLWGTTCMFFVIQFGVVAIGDIVGVYRWSLAPFENPDPEIHWAGMAGLFVVSMAIYAASFFDCWLWERKHGVAAQQHTKQRKDFENKMVHIMDKGTPVLPPPIPLAQNPNVGDRDL